MSNAALQLDHEFFVATHVRLILPNTAGARYGDDPRLDFTQFPIVFVARLTVKGALVLNKTATVEGVYDRDPALNTQQAVVTLTAAETSTLPLPFPEVGGRYVRVLPCAWWKMTGGGITVLAYGDVTVVEVTQHEV